MMPSANIPTLSLIHLLTYEVAMKLHESHTVYGNPQGVKCIKIQEIDKQILTNIYLFKPQT